MTSFSVDRIPYEIIEAIISLNDDRKTLAACSLTCRAWVAPSQSRLFRHLRLNQKILEKSGPFLTLLDNKPHISTSVRVLQVAWWDRVFCGPGDDVDRMSCGPADVEDLISCLTGRLVRVEMFHLDFNSSTVLRADLGLLLAKAFPALRILQIEDCRSHTFADIILANPRLQLVSIGMPFEIVSPVKDIPRGPRKSTSSSLTQIFWSTNHSLDQLFQLILRQPTIRLYSLFLLDFSMWGWDKFPVLENILGALGSNLECLRLYSESWYGGHPSLALNTCLRTLELGTFSLRPRFDLPCHISNTDDLLAVLSTAISPSLENVIIYFWCTHVFDLKKVDWSRLDRILHGATSLRRVTIVLPESVAEGIDAATRRIRGWLSSQPENVLITVWPWVYIPYGKSLL